MKTMAIDITGQKFGILTAIRFDHITRGHYYWLFRCECGKESVAEKGHVLKGEIKSCGCLSSRHTIGGRSKTHGLRNTRFYHVWITMKQRCNNPKNARYKN